MSIINVEYDTSDKSMTVKQDGKVLKDVRYVSFGPSYDMDAEPDEMSCNISMQYEDEEDGMKTYTQMCCSKKDEESGLFPESKDINGFFIKSNLADGVNHVQDYLTKFMN